MSEQDEALRLADQLGTCSLQVGEVEQIHAAFHLRRQHAEIERLRQERDALREALTEVVSSKNGYGDYSRWSVNMQTVRRAREVLAAKEKS